MIARIRTAMIINPHAGGGNTNVIHPLAAEDLFETSPLSTIVTMDLLPPQVPARGAGADIRTRRSTSRGIRFVIRVLVRQRVKKLRGSRGR